MTSCRVTIRVILFQAKFPSRIHTLPACLGKSLPPTSRTLFLPITKEESVKDTLFTYNLQGDGKESLTIRCDTEEELSALRDKWRAILVTKVAPKAPQAAPVAVAAPTAQESQKKLTLQPGDPCGKCGEDTVLRTGTNRTTGKEFKFIGCSTYPKCDFNAHVSKSREAA